MMTFVLVLLLPQPVACCAGLAACDEDKKEDGGVRACGVCVCVVVVGVG